MLGFIRTRRWSGLATVFILAAACAPADRAEDQAPAPPDPAGALTYQGDIPCADCPGIQMAVTLFPDSTYRLRNTYLEGENGGDVVVHEMGRWQRTGDELLLATGGTPWRYRYMDGETVLRMLDAEGGEVLSGLNYDLALQDEVDPIDGPMEMQGMYLYMADAASFTECRTGRTFPVLIEADHISLERAYLASSEPGQPALAEFEGRFVERSPEAGMPPREHIIVERFDRLAPDEDCGENSLLP